MATHDHAHDHVWTHDHRFLGHGHERAERRARLATIFIALFMVVEIAAGLLFRSMALLADGVHMATHVGALGLAAAAYWLARRHAQDQRLAFGSGKFGDLAAFGSAVALGLAAVGIAIESVERLFQPAAIDYRSALPIAALGLIVNLGSAFILRDDHHHDHDHPHPHVHGGADHNMRAAYAHVLADAVTSLLAIFALAAGLIYGLRWLDPVVGILGSFVIASWSIGLMRDAGAVLLDAQADPKAAGDIRAMIEREFGAGVSDLHLWQLGPGHRGLIVSLVSPDEDTAARIRIALRERYADLSHVTVEVAVCADCAPAP